jgi:hypothetical protein
MNIHTLHDDNEDLPDTATAGEEDEEMAGMSEEELGDVLREALDLHAKANGLTSPKMYSFADAGYLTMNTGLVVRMGGDTFELTIVRRS